MARCRVARQPQRCYAVTPTDLAVAAVAIERAPLASQLQPLIEDASAAIEGFSSTTAGQHLASAWSACMAGNGYHYNSPQDAQTAFENNRCVTSLEIATRMADLNCDTTVGLTRARSEYEETKLGTWLTQHTANITTVTDTIQAAQQELAARRLALSGQGADALQHP